MLGGPNKEVNWKFSTNSKELRKHKHKITSTVLFYLCGRQTDTCGFYILTSVHNFDHKVDSFQGNTREKTIYKELFETPHIAH